ncbi:cytochrome b561 and DOMON domain-containing protein At3g25290-like [Vicia villosa]|uniref:cytochrome b561 and DOMON domain-containing protein At3g25290-like n=1 Tax=Vicia villosa TaxID=3911 RepID=UPI00273C419E|nr:cytochrome b561 and DOMON domain-containing protein At3g25290-like [Vicia villosa]
MSSSPTLISFVILSFLLVNIDANHRPCGEKFAKLIEQKNITACKRLRTQGAEFGWNYHNSPNSTTLEILFGAILDTSQGWIAWGVNPEERAEMIGTKAIIGIKNPDFATTSSSTLRVHTYDVTNETKRGCTLLPSKNIGLNVSHMMFQDEGSNFYTIYARLVLPSDEYNITRLNHVWQIGHAVSWESPLRHPINLNNVDSTETIDLTSPHGPSTGQFRSSLQSVHGVLSIIGWGTMLPLGVIIPRYFRVYPFRREPWWFFLHIGCQLTGFLIGTAAFVIGLVLGRSSRYYIFQTHRNFGIIIFTFSTIQMLAFRLKPAVTDDYRKYWNIYHHFLGYGLLAIIIINIFKGIGILNGGDKWKWSYIGILICLGAIAFALEIFTWIRFLIIDEWIEKHRKKKEKNEKEKNEKEKKEKEDKEKLEKASVPNQNK